MLHQCADYPGNVPITQLLIQKGGNVHCVDTVRNLQGAAVLPPHNTPDPSSPLRAPRPRLPPTNARAHTLARAEQEVPGVDS